jgi:hypothetical protein
MPAKYRRLPRKNVDGSYFAPAKTAAASMESTFSAAASAVPVKFCRSLVLHDRLARF